MTGIYCQTWYLKYGINMYIFIFVKNMKFSKWKLFHDSTLVMMYRNLEHIKCSKCRKIEFIVHFERKHITKKFLDGKNLIFFVVTFCMCCQINSDMSTFDFLCSIWKCGQLLLFPRSRETEVNQNMKLYKRNLKVFVGSS